MDFNEKKQFYVSNFGLGYLGKDIQSKIKLICLICAMYEKVKETKPSLTMIQLINSINRQGMITDSMAEGLAIMCEDFAYGCSDFPTFGIQPKDYIKVVKEILTKALPF